MPERTQYAPGTPSWVDLQTSDPGRRQDVLRRAVRLGLRRPADGPDAAGNDAFYSMAKKNGKDVAAIAPLPMPGVPPHWNTYVTVADVDTTAAQVPGAGGTVIDAAVRRDGRGPHVGRRRSDRRDVLPLAGEEPASARSS